MRTLPTLIAVSGILGFCAASTGSEWAVTFGGSEMAWAVRQTADGGYVVLGSTFDYGAESQDLIVLKLDPDGNIVWHEWYGGSSADYAMSIQLTVDGGYSEAPHAFRCCKPFSTSNPSELLTDQSPSVRARAG